MKDYEVLRQCERKRTNFPEKKQKRRITQNVVNRIKIIIIVIYKLELFYLLIFIFIASLYYVIFERKISR